MEVSLSFWEKEVFYRKVDLVVIGSGIVGMTAAIAFKRDNPSASIRVIDATTFPQGASTRNAGFACFGSMTELVDDIDKNGEQACMALVEKRWLGLQTLRSLVGDRHMDFQQLGGNEIFLSDDKATYEKILGKIDRMNDLLSSALSESNIFSLSTDSYGIKSLTGMIHNRLEGQLNPGKMVQRLIELAKEMGIEIVRGAAVIDIESNSKEVICHFKNNQQIKADQVLVATNGFSNKLISDLDLKPARNQVLLTKPIPNLPIKGCFHYDQGYVYFRNVGKRLLLGGGRHWDIKTAETSNYGDNEFVQAKLLKFMQSYLLPETKFEIEHRWSGILGVGKEKNPIVKYIKPKVAVAIRMGGMGVAIGASVGNQAADLLSDK